MGLKQICKSSNFGLVIDWKFHKQNRWVCSLTSYLVDSIIKEFDPIIITSQLEYNILKKKLKYIVSMEPGWAAPTIKYDTTIDCKKAVFYSDPHYETEKRMRYFEVNEFNFVFSYYKKPFFYHFKNFPCDKFVHMPWAIPDQFISKNEIEIRNNDVIIFGGKNSDAYDVRNWCREQDCIVNFNNSGVENKIFTDEEYFLWLNQFDAIVAAGSSDSKYNLVTPKYFEIASAGSLLVGQYCDDLQELGFNENNALIFTKETFLQKILEYRKNPQNYLNVRVTGRELIKEKHKISDRIRLIRRVFYGID